jgi:hypothetical protein
MLGNREAASKTKIVKVFVILKVCRNSSLRPRAKSLKESVILNNNVLVQVNNNVLMVSVEDNVNFNA